MLSEPCAVTMRSLTFEFLNSTIISLVREGADNLQSTGSVSNST